MQPVYSGFRIVVLEQRNAFASDILEHEVLRLYCKSGVMSVLLGGNLVPEANQMIRTTFLDTHTHMVLEVIEG